MRISALLGEEVTMRRAIATFGPMLACVAAVCGCGGSGPSGSGGLAVVDLDEVAKQLGRDEHIKAALDAKEAELGAELRQAEAALNAEYRRRAQSANYLPGETQRLQAEINGRLRQAQQDSRTKLADYRMGLVTEFREEIKPVAQQIALDRGLSIVVPKNDSLLLAFEPGVEITSAVIEQMKSAQPAEQVAEAPDGNARQ
jgi:Skp family chaperone for outer membrane proteins